MARPHDRPRAAAAPPDATPVVRKSRAEAIASLLANGLTLAEIQEEEERAAALNAIACVPAIGGTRITNRSNGRGRQLPRPTRPRPLTGS